MLEKKKILCVLGGIYFLFDYLLNQISGILEKLPKSYFFECTALFVNGLSLLLTIAFIILFVKYLIKQQKILFLERFINKFPKISVYLFYFGFCGYILFIIDILLSFPIIFITINDTMKNFLLTLLLFLNIGGILISLILASKDVFFKQKIHFSKIK